MGCRFFAEEGNCKFGSQCIRKHDINNVHSSILLHRYNMDHLTDPQVLAYLKIKREQQNHQQQQQQQHQQQQQQQQKQQQQQQQQQQQHQNQQQHQQRDIQQLKQQEAQQLQQLTQQQQQLQQPTVDDKQLLLEKMASMNG